MSTIGNRIELYSIKIEYFKLLYSTISFHCALVYGGKLTVSFTDCPK